MENFKGTKGQWRVQRLQTPNKGNINDLIDSNTYCIHTQSPHRIIANVHINHAPKLSKKFQKENEANAKLIASSPDLLKELQWEVDFLEGLLNDGLEISSTHSNTINSRIEILKQAINKATSIG